LMTRSSQPLSARPAAARPLFIQTRPVRT
jgi:hypothetical protein